MESFPLPPPPLRSSKRRRTNLLLAHLPLRLQPQARLPLGETLVFSVQSSKPAPSFKMSHPTVSITSRGESKGAAGEGEGDRLGKGLLLPRLVAVGSGGHQVLIGYGRFLGVAGHGGW
jgi:hypothetical protein